MVYACSIPGGKIGYKKRFIRKIAELKFLEDDNLKQKKIWAIPRKMDNKSHRQTLIGV